MRQICLLLIVLVATATVAHAGTPVWITSDVPTDETLNGLTLLPFEIYKYDGAGYTLELSVPGDPDLNAIHRLDEPGDWLFSVEAPNDLGGALLPAGVIAEPRDLIHYDSSAATYTLCFSGAAAGLPPETNVDAAVVEGGDPTCSGGSLLLSFDAPTDIPPFVGPLAFEPADLARFVPLGIGPCPGWAVSAANPAFDASAAGGGVPITSITEGADRMTDYTSAIAETILALDVPSDLAPLPMTYVPGELVITDSVTFSLFEPLVGWPTTSVVDGLSCGGNPGRVPPTMVIGKAVLPPTDIVLTWAPSCSQGADDYGVHEGTIGVWYGHTAIDCLDGGAPLTEQVTPGAGDTYYLVVADNGCRGEGSYGMCDTAVCLAADERPKGVASCASPHVVTCCP